MTKTIFTTTFVVALGLRTSLKIRRTRLKRNIGIMMGTRMDYSNTRWIRITGFLALALLSLAGCAGAKILKEPIALELQEPLIAQSSSSLNVALDWVIVRDGLGSWSRNADWDEYLFRVHNLSDNVISIESVTVYDSLGTMISSNSQRKQLIRESKVATKRYKSEGLEVKAGMGGATLVALGVGSYVAAAATIAVAVSTSSIALAGVAVVGVIAAPVLVVGAIFRSSENSKVSHAIEDRHTVLPLILEADSEKALDIFFPLSPSPRRIEISYTDADGSHLMTINTMELLEGLHLGASE